jgi:tetratricopeptide (TPR) repeat protein
MNQILTNVLSTVTGRKDRAKDALLAKADQARDSRDWQAARDLYAEYVQAYGYDAAIWVQYGHALKELGDHRSAMGAYKRSLTLIPDAADTHLQLGHVCKLLKQRGDARDAYRTRWSWTRRSLTRPGSSAHSAKLWNRTMIRLRKVFRVTSGAR